MGLRKRLSIILFIILLSLTPTGAMAATRGEISDQLICQCGCTLVLTNCTHSECMSRDAMLTFIEQKLTEGQSGEQIIQAFVTQYGEQVLSSPPKKGFNLMAWITPFAAILLGAVVIFIALKKWVRQGHQIQPDSTDDNDEMNEEYQRRLDKELSEFGERSFR